jgi:hypothetical protein
MDGNSTTLSAKSKGSDSGKTRENDREKFVDLANRRVSKALQTIKLIGNLSNRSNYDYTPDDVAKIFKALQEEIAGCRKRFDLALNKQSVKKFNLE